MDLALIEMGGQSIWRSSWSRAGTLYHRRIGTHPFWLAGLRHHTIPAQSVSKTNNHVLVQPYCYENLDRGFSGQTFEYPVPIATRPAVCACKPPDGPIAGAPREGPRVG